MIVRQQGGRRMVKKVIKDKRVWLIGIGILLVAGILFFWMGQRELDVTKKVKVQFKGYDGDGEASYNEKEIEKLIETEILKKQKLKKEDIEGILNEDKVTYSRLINDSDMRNKLEVAETMRKELDYGFDRTSGLKNGDKITFTVKSKSSEIPIKMTQKTFTVKGLKKSHKISFQEIEEKHPIKFKGFNQFGYMKQSKFYEEKTTDNSDFDSQKLTNGDEVLVTLSSDYINKLKENGQFVTGKKTKRIKVNGLQQAKEIPNLEKVLVRSDQQVREKYPNEDDDGFGGKTTYKIERKDTYFSNQKEANNANVDSQADSYFDLLSVYKITKTVAGSSISSFNESSVQYMAIGYTDIPYQDDRFVLSEELFTSQSTNSGSLWGGEDTEQAVISELKEQGMKKLE